MPHTLFLIVIISSAVALGISLALVVRGVMRRRKGVVVNLKPMIYTALAMLLVNLAAVICDVEFNNRFNKTMRQNPFFSEWTTPFGVPPFDLITPADYVPAFERAMTLQTAAVDSIVASREAVTFANTVEALDRSGGELMRVANVFYMLCDAESTPEMQQIQEQISPLLSAHSDAVMMNPALFDKIKTVYDHRGELCSDSAQIRLTEKTYKQFVRNGALLDSVAKAELSDVNSRLSVLDVKFTSNVLAATNDYKLVLSEKDIIGLPASVCTAAQNKAAELGLKNKYVFTLQAPSWIPFLTYSTRADLRKQLYEAYLNRCAEGSTYDNTGVINDIVKLRLRKAQLLGFSSYAAFVLDDVMAKTPENVYGLLDSLWTPALDKARQELSDMRELKYSDMVEERANDEPVEFDDESVEEQPSEQSDSVNIDNVPFESWDWWFYAEKVRRNKYSFDEESLRPYLSLSNVRQGIFELSNRLYGITFRPIEVPVYNSECQTYEVLDRDNSHLAVLYLDFFPRAGKQSGAWCGGFRESGYDESGKRISPVISIVCNFSRPANDGIEALLTVDETETFFHEFGHALHGFFTDVPYYGLSGVERDFVELPSQIMENWAFEPQLLKTYALHNRTGDVVPERIVRKLSRSREFNQGFATVELLAASLSDMDIHNIKEYTQLDVAAFEKYMLQNKRGLMPQIEPRYRYPYFKHIFGGGYASGYYSYLWAEVLDKDAYEAFRESGDIFNTTVARRFREKILSQGGMYDGMRMYNDFRGKAPSREPLLRARGLWKEQPADSLATQGE